MHRAALSLLPVFVLCALATFGTRAIVASDTLLHLTGWAEIPSTYRHPDPVSGQFAGPANGVTPPYAGQPIPGFSGMIPGPTPETFYALPDNGFGAQTNSADFVIGFYVVRPWFKTTGDGSTSRGPVTVQRFTPFSDPNGYLDKSYITDGPVYARTFYYAVGPQIAVAPAIKNGRLLTGADFDVESIARMDDGTFWVGEEFGPYLLHFDAQGRLLRAPVRHPVLRAPQNPDNAVMGPANLPSSRGFESMTRNGDGSRLYVTTESSIDTQSDKRILQIFEFDTAADRGPARHRRPATRSATADVRLPAAVGGVRDTGGRLHRARRPEQQLPGRQRAHTRHTGWHGDHHASLEGATLGR